MPVLVRVSDWGIDLRSRTEGREGREERGREAMHPSVSDLRRLLKTYKSDSRQDPSHQPRMHCMQGRQKHYHTLTRVQCTSPVWVVLRVPPNFAIKLGEIAIVGRTQYPP